MPTTPSKERAREGERANDWNCQSTSAQIGYVLNDMAIRLSVIAVSKNDTFTHRESERTRYDISKMEEDEDEEKRQKANKIKWNRKGEGKGTEWKKDLKPKL